MGLAFVAQVLLADGVRTVGGRLGGDLPAFVGAARLLLAGGDLYDPVAQARAQLDLVPDGTFAWFAYPPIVAAAYIPLTWLPWRVAVLAHAVGMGLVAGLGVRAWARRLGLDPRVAVPAALTFYPLLRAVTGGQSTGLLLLLFAGPPLLAGFALYKPQLAALPLLTRAPLAPLAPLAGAALVWAGSALVAGPAWPVPWLAAAVRFGAAAHADPGGVSLWDHPLPGAGLAVLVACAWRVRRDPERRFALALAAAPLVAPHALFYDVGLLVLPFGVLAARHGRAALPWLAGAWLAGLAMVAFPGAVGTALLLTTAVLLTR